MSREHRLCLLLAGEGTAAAARPALLEMLNSSIRWEEVMRQLVWNEVEPQAYAGLSEVEFHGVPAGVREELEGRCRANLLHGMLLTEELVRLLHQMNSAAIPVMPLKGPILAERLRKDTGARVSRDLDLLVPVRHVRQAYDLLARQGYEAQVPRWFLDGLALKNCFELAFTRSEGQLRYVVELHWGILWEAGGGRSTMRELWDDSRPGVFRGADVRETSPEWLLMILSAHASRHDWQGLKWLLDIHYLSVAGEGIDWDRAAQIADRLRWRELVEMSLSVCEQLLGTPVPDRFSRLAVPESLGVFPAPPHVVSEWRNTHQALRIADGPVAKVKLFLLRLLVPTATDAAWCRLPPRWGFLYYLLRPLRILRQLTRPGGSGR